MVYLALLSGTHVRKWTERAGREKPLQYGLMTGLKLWWGFPGGSVVKNPPVKQETWVRSLGREDPLEKGMKTHSNILAWEIPWREEPGGLQSMGSQRVRHNWVTNTHTSVWTHMSFNLYTYLCTYIQINIEKDTDVCLCVRVCISLFTIAVSTFDISSWFLDASLK